MRFRDFKPTREHARTDCDANYRKLIIAILTQAVRDYASKPDFRPSIGRFFDGKWCAALCEETNFPREIFKQREGIIEAGKRLRQGRKQRVVAK